MLIVFQEEVCISLLVSSAEVTGYNFDPTKEHTSIRLVYPGQRKNKQRHPLFKIKSKHLIERQNLTPDCCYLLENQCNKLFITNTDTF